MKEVMVVSGLCASAVTALMWQPHKKPSEQMQNIAKRGIGFALNSIGSGLCSQDQRLTDMKIIRHSIALL